MEKYINILVFIVESCACQQVIKRKAISFLTTNKAWDHMLGERCTFGIWFGFSSLINFLSLWYSVSDLLHRDMQHLWHGGGSKSLFQDSFPDSQLIFRGQHAIGTLQNQTQRKKLKYKNRLKKLHKVQEILVLILQ